MSGTQTIRKLDETVVNRIAAGEVIQRPANALKELLENSLDAKSSNISITLKNGGLKLLQIQDNGVGIRKDDLDIVCERFTTSKLKHFEDLATISTFGFRGEALASISHVAHLTITTKTAEDTCAYKASYEDGKLKFPPKPCAANQGTTISVEDLFYNISTRKKAFKNASEEHSRVADVVCRYAVHNPLVGFNVKKYGESISHVKTSPNSTYIDNIRVIYGNNIARELLEIESKDEVFKFCVHGFISNVNYSTKKQIFILFINNRLVDSVALRKCLEVVYGIYLPKGSHPFIYLSLEMEPRNIDVNVHPTKHEVHFLHEEAIINSVRSVVEYKLLGANTSRVFYTQAKLPKMDVGLKSAVLEKAGTGGGPVQNMVRTDSNAQKLDKFLSQPQTETPSLRREIKLTSVLSLRLEVEEESNLALRNIVANLIYVGAVSPQQALVQHSTALYLFNTKHLLRELIYQTMLYDFGNLGIIKFKEGLDIYKVSMLGLEDPTCGWAEEDGCKEELAKKVTDLLLSKASMLQDYFSIHIDKSGLLFSIPLIIDGYMPDISRLPFYLLRLACDVDWTSEKPCFKTICKETSKFYSSISTVEQDNSKSWDWVVEHVVYPAIKFQLLPPKSFATDETILQIANLPDLYKVFERC